jgi:hypothetical protein
MGGVVVACCLSLSGWKNRLPVRCEKHQIHLHVDVELDQSPENRGAEVGSRNGVVWRQDEFQDRGQRGGGDRWQSKVSAQLFFRHRWSHRGRAEDSA